MTDITINPNTATDRSINIDPNAVPDYSSTPAPVVPGQVDKSISAPVEQAPEPEAKTVPLFGPDGKLYDVPSEKSKDAITAGGSPASPIIAPGGSHLFVPANKLHDALKAGAKIDDTGWTPEQERLNHRSVAQKIQDVFAGPNTVGEDVSKAAAEAVHQWSAGVDPDKMTAEDKEKVKQSIQDVKNNPNYSPQPLAESVLRKELDKPIVNLTNAAGPEWQKNHPMLTELLNTASGLSTPENVIIMAGTEGLGALSGPEAKLASQVLPKLMSGYFGAGAVLDAIKTSPEVWDAIKRGDESEALRLVTHVVTDLGMGAMAGQHVAGVEARPTTNIGRRLQAPVDALSTRVSQAMKSDANALATASAVHDSASAVLDHRLNESRTMADQAIEASHLADQAKVDFTNGKITRQQLDAANTTASKAASEARKSTQALSDAHLSLSQAESELNRMNRKVSQPSLVERAYSGTVDSIGAMLGRTNDFDTAIKRASKIPSKQVAAHMEKIANVREDLQSLLNDNANNIEGPKDVANAIDTHIQKNESRLQKMSGATKNSEEPVVENITHRLIERLDKFFDDNKGLYGDDQDVYEAKKRILEGILQSRNGQHLLEPNLFEAENVRRRLSREGKPQYATNATPTTDAYKAGALEAAKELRKAIDESYQSRGADGVKEWRAKEASLIDIRDRLYDAQEKADKAGEGTIFRSLMKKIGAPSSVIAIALGHPVSGAAIGAAVLGDQISQNLTNPNVNVNRAVDIAGKNPSAQVTIPKENTPLHGSLASHFGEIVGQSTYTDLENRFLGDIADKTRHNVPLEGSEQKIVNMLNDNKIKEAQQTQKQREKIRQSAPPRKRATLPEDYESAMPIEGDLPNNMGTQEGLVHELAHAHVGAERGIKFIDGIRSHLHSENKSSGSGLSIPIDWTEFVGEDGKIDPAKIKTRAADLAATYVAGGVANDLWHGIPLTENEGLGADLSILKTGLRNAGFSQAEVSRMIAQATDDAAQSLSKPNVREIIEQHAQVREPDLDTKHHFSQERLDQVLEDLKDGTNAKNGKNTPRNAAGNVPGVQQPAKEDGAGTEAANKEGNTTKLRQEKQGPVEGKSEPVRGNESNPKFGGSGELKGDQVESVLQGGHAGGGVASEEELARAGRFVKISRSGTPTDQGKTPDFNLQEGEAGYQVKPDGSYERMAGQETPVTKRGVESYAKEVFPNPKLSETAERLPKIENLRVPTERTTGEHDEAIKEGGAIPGGIQEGDPELDIPNYAIFHDPATGSSLMLPVDKVTSENVASQLKKSRAVYIAAEDRKAQAGLGSPKLSTKQPEDMLRSEIKTELGITGSDLRNGLPNKKLIDILKNKRAELGNPKLSSRVSTRVPSGKSATENPLEGEPLIINRKSVEASPQKLQDRFASKVRDIPGVKMPKNITDNAKVFDRFINHVSDNLKFLYNQSTPEEQANNSKWYDSAHDMTKKLAEDNVLAHPQVAGVTAALSPQMDWDSNVSLAKRTVDIYRNHLDKTVTPEMIQKGKDIVQKSRIGKDKKANENLNKILPKIEGKSIGELKGWDRAAAVRLYDEVNNPRTFPRIDPATGNEMELRTNANGSTSSVAWGNLNNIAKALSILDDGSRSNISEQVGSSHKVRNFFNNIIDPSNDQDVTIDTHAVAAALLQPLGGNATEVLDNFGRTKAKSTGVSGTYPLYADAYRQAAKDLGLKPRELQSVVWEKVRNVFPAEWKTKANYERVISEWKKYQDGKQSLNQARQNIVELPNKKLDTAGKPRDNKVKSGLAALGE